MRLLHRTLGLLMISLILTGCTKAGLFLANIPAKFSNARQHIDIPYGEDPVQKLDLFIPTDTKNPAVLVFFYGGRWTDGNKEQYRFIADSFVAEGYAVVIADYRKYPNVKFPAFAEDMAAASAWVYKNAPNYNLNRHRFYVVGHSAGAHTGALIATDPQYLAAHNLDRDIITAFVGLSGPYAFKPEAEDLKDMFGPPEKYSLMRAPNFVDGAQPPVLLMHGLEDTTVVLENAEKLKKAIEEKGGAVKLLTYDSLNHVETVGSLMWFWRYKSNIKEDMLKFFEENK